MQPAESNDNIPHQICIHDVNGLHQAHCRPVKHAALIVCQPKQRCTTVQKLDIQRALQWRQPRRARLHTQRHACGCHVHLLPHARLHVHDVQIAHPLQPLRHRGRNFSPIQHRGARRLATAKLANPCSRHAPAIHEQATARHCQRSRLSGCRRIASPVQSAPTHTSCVSFVHKTEPVQCVGHGRLARGAAKHHDLHAHHRSVVLTQAWGGACQLSSRGRPRAIHSVVGAQGGARRNAVFQLRHHAIHEAQA
mmetsp:Transcript_9278/g.29281  ORF Transcript_9278/g.29281 Transcript_9278/m.29281 type:complete len:251 (+) Transcript_9278:508-1260(+)